MNKQTNVILARLAKTATQVKLIMLNTNTEGNCKRSKLAYKL